MSQYLPDDVRDVREAERAAAVDLTDWASAGWTGEVSPYNVRRENARRASERETERETQHV